MALRFRHDPQSFELTRYLIDHVISATSSDTTEQIFGYAVLFTKDKKKKVKGSASPHSFTTFQKSFLRWLQTHSSEELEAAKSLLKGSRAVGSYSRPGKYDRSGNFLSEFDVGEDEFQDPSYDTQAQSSRQSDTREGHDTSHHRDDEAAEDFHPGFSTSASNSAATNAAQSRGSSRGESFRSTKEQKTAAMTNMDMAMETMKEASVLDSKVARKIERFGSYDLGRRMRPGIKEVHVPVSRGDYSQVTRKIVRGDNGGYVITGPTGCGKSTVALLPLFLRKSRVLVVEPTQANAANVFHEFRNVLPNLFASGIIHSPVPQVKFVAPTVTKPPYPPLSVTTTDKLLEFFDFYGKLPEVDYLVVDEFHLPIPSMVEVVELVRTFDLTPKYVFVSATAQGFKVEPQLPAAVTPIYGNLPMGKIPSDPVNSDLDPRRWFGRGDGTVAIVAPSTYVAEKLVELYRSWRLRVFLVTRFTYVSEYMLAATNYQSNTVYVLEPGVEAGVTLSMSVLISMGCTTAVRYDGSVVVEDTQPLDPIAAIQRGGRGGRVRPTLYVQPRAPEVATPKSSADYYRAQAVIKLVSVGADVNFWKDDSLFATFPKLSTLTRSMALSAAASGADPFVAVYSRNAEGQVYRECGGQGLGFSDMAAHELALYHYAKGFFIAPIADFSRADSQPYNFVQRASQLDAAWAMAASVPGLLDRFSLDDLVGLLVGKFDIYVTDLFTRLRGIFNKAEPTKFSLGSNGGEYPEVSHFLRDSPPLVKLFEYMTSQPVGVRYDCKQFPGSPKRASHSFSYGSTTLNFAFDDKYMVKHSLNTKLLSDDVYSLLQGLLAVEMMIVGAAEKCVDLTAYRGRVTDEHLWFKDNVVDR